MNSSNSIAPARHSATVILLREDAGQVQLLLTRRHQGMAFMGGLWVFPGGTLCPADSAAPALASIAAARAAGPEFTTAEGEIMPMHLQQALAIAACRETFEETGVVLAHSAHAAHCDPDTAAQLQQQRSTVLAHPEMFATVLAQAGLQPAVEQLTYWAHWITPLEQPRRFDTRFFLACLPPGQQVTLDDNEAVDSLWQTPAELLDAANDGVIKLSPPTLYNVMDIAHALQQHGSLHAVLASAIARDIPPVMPRVIRGERMTIVMPWDPEYPQEGQPAIASDYPDYLTRLPARTPGYR